jgi:hypothetical protein
MLQSILDIYTFLLKLSRKRKVKEKEKEVEMYSFDIYHPLTNQTADNSPKTTSNHSTPKCLKSNPRPSISSRLSPQSRIIRRYRRPASGIIGSAKKMEFQISAAQNTGESGYYNALVLISISKSKLKQSKAKQSIEHTKYKNNNSPPAPTYNET